MSAQAGPSLRPYGWIACRQDWHRVEQDLLRQGPGFGGGLAYLPDGGKSTRNAAASTPNSAIRLTSASGTTNRHSHPSTNRPTAVLYLAATSSRRFMICVIQPVSCSMSFLPSGSAWI